MKRSSLFLTLILFSFVSVSGQTIDFGIQYIPVQISMITFDQKNIIYPDYTSAIITDPKFRMSVPSLSNAGFFVRFNKRSYSIQSGLGFHNNVYSYSHKATYSMSSFVSLFYSSIDLPVIFSYTLFPEEKLKMRLLAGSNFKMFRLRRSYYSVFARNFDYFSYAEESVADREKKSFMVNKINPFVLYFRIGFGIKYYGFNADLYLDRNITSMNNEIDLYNANFKNTSQINLALGFTIAPKDLKAKKSKDRITK